MINSVNSGVHQAELIENSNVKNGGVMPKEEQERCTRILGQITNLKKQINHLQEIFNSSNGDDEYVKNMIDVDELALRNSYGELNSIEKKYNR